MLHFSAVLVRYLCITLLEHTDTHSTYSVQRFAFRGVDVYATKSRHHWYCTPARHLRNRCHRTLPTLGQIPISLQNSLESSTLPNVSGPLGKALTPSSIMHSPTHLINSNCF